MTERDIHDDHCWVSYTPNPAELFCTSIGDLRNYPEECRAHDRRSYKRPDLLYAAISKEQFNEIYDSDTPAKCLSDWFGLRYDPSIDYSPRLRGALRRIVDFAVKNGKYVDKYSGDAGAYGMNFENNVFLMRPDYMDDECSCGQSERLDEWYSKNPHHPMCYYSVLNRKLDEWEAENPEIFPDSESFVQHGTGFSCGMHINKPTQESRDWYDRKRTYEHKLMDELCAQHGIDRNAPGAAVHCTCGRDARATEWRVENPHNFRCKLVIPNFWYKPDDFRISWYKHLGRDMKPSRVLMGGSLEKIEWDCINSLR